MIEAIVSPSLEVTIIDSPIPEPKANEVLIKVICSGTNPKDWKAPFHSKSKHNSGDDIAGIVEKVGDGVLSLRPGDRVAAFHEMKAPSGSFAEFAIAPAHTTFQIPPHISFEEAATIPLAAYTAVVGLYDNLKLPPPWNPATSSTPLLIYGASSAVGTFAIKLALRSNIHPIIAIAGKAKDMTSSLLDLSKGDLVLDYRDGLATMAEKVQTVLKQSNLTLRAAFDAISEKRSVEFVSSLVVPGGYITFVLPEKDYSTVSPSINTSLTYVGEVH
ncbi:chaperonin 10-like protein, partial [Xylogone sp. PMI_703]